MGIDIYYVCVHRIKVKQGNKWLEKWGFSFYSDYINQIAYDTQAIRAVSVYTSNQFTTTYLSGLNLLTDEGIWVCVGRCSKQIFVDTISPGGFLSYITAKYTTFTDDYGYIFSRFCLITFSFTCA